MRLFAAILLCSTLAHADAARQILDELVAIDTSNPPGNEAAAARAMAARLAEAGLKPTLVEFAPGRANVVARLHGDGSKKALLLLAHLDVVGAANQPWTVPPFKVTERDGWLYGRGVIDDKGWAAVATAVFLDLAKQKPALHRDVVLALTGDEESGGAGIRWLIDHRKDLIGDVEIGLNEGGGLKLERDQVVSVSFQAAEKTYQSYELVARGMGGHASVPNEENAIYRLARALDRMSAYKFPARLTPTVRESLRAAAEHQPEPRASALRVVAASKEAELPADAMMVLDAYPLTRAATRTTCVATLISGGTRENALPVEAKATVNCRVMPVDKLADVQRALETAIGDASVAVKPIVDMGWGPEISVDGVVPQAIRKAARELWGDKVTVTPSVGTGATDSRFLRRVGVQSYGIGVLPKPEELKRAPHGPDEGVPAASLAVGVRWLSALVTALQ
jgi:acetylornithine deacetylase/succinyl-diaminopimelate desuccinylase-like protein